MFTCLLHFVAIFKISQKPNKMQLPESLLIRENRKKT